ncbi:MAG: type II toxin-antitoxin system prevent-host-death family antitoxin [Rhodobacteraceae bacterium]|nr:type II toxin-antitoxin system prevent-host-death family antitoxin [Paracoccaceae bacterium]MCY4139916.1 type II toxin-antitoxin system prevent-host-death family antitoxin [Paracoccaceae bacterium]
MTTLALEADLTITTVTSRGLNQDVARAKKAAKSGPVFITDRGKPAHVLLSIEDYRRLAGQGRSLTEALSMPGLAEIEFNPARTRIEATAPDLS